MKLLQPQGLGQGHGILHQGIYGEKPGVLGKLQAPARTPLVEVDDPEILQVVLKPFPQGVGVPPRPSVKDQEGRGMLVPHVLHVKLRLPYGDVADFFPHPL